MEKRPVEWVSFRAKLSAKIGTMRPAEQQPPHPMAMTPITVGALPFIVEQRER